MEEWRKQQDFTQPFQVDADSDSDEDDTVLGAGGGDEDEDDEADQDGDGTDDEAAKEVLQCMGDTVRITYPAAGRLFQRRTRRRCCC